MSAHWIAFNWDETESYDPPEAIGFSREESGVIRVIVENNNEGAHPDDVISHDRVSLVRSKDRKKHNGGVVEYDVVVDGRDWHWLSVWYIYD